MKLICTLCLVGLALAQGGRTIPPTDDRDHAGQPSWCQREDGNGYAHNCNCKGMTDDNGDGMCTPDGKQEPHGDPKCKTYCRRNKCYCHVECSRPTR